MKYDHEANVDRGIALLDEKVPGWDGYIDLPTLALSSCRSCVIGQVMHATGRADAPHIYNDNQVFEAGLALLGIEDWGTGDQEHGFNLHELDDIPVEDDEDYWPSNGDWRDLTETWKRKILARRSDGSSA